MSQGRDQDDAGGMMGGDMEKMVVVGSGPAGLCAALYGARANLDPLVIDGLQPGGQLTTTLAVENYPGFPEGIDGTQLVEQMRRQAGRFGARFVRDEVVSADFGSRPLRLNLAGGSRLASASVILATGASAKYLGLDSERKLIGKGVSACATCDGAFYRDQPVAVVGGGDTAMEEALFLARTASRVTLIHRRDRFRASEIMSARVQQNGKIDILWDSVVEEVLGTGQEGVTGLRVRNVKTGSTAPLDVRGVFMAIGHKPNTDAFQGQVKMDAKGFIVAANTRTNVEGVFAAGDVQDPTYRQAVTAAGSGCMAALEAERYLTSIAV